MDERPLKILIIELGPLGNWVLATGLFRAIRLHYPKATLYHLTQTDFAELATAQGCFDKLLLTRWEGFHNLKEFFESMFLEPIWRKKISEIGFDIIFDLHRTAKTRNIFYKHLTSKQIQIFSNYGEYPHPHMLNVYQAIGAEAGIFYNSSPQIKTADSNIVKPFSVLIPRSRWERHRQNWPLEKFKELALRLQKCGLPPLIVGHRRDLVALKPLRRMPGNRDLAGQTTLYALSGILAKASLVIGVDTGTTHLAAAVGAPTLALYGPTPLEIWGIRGPQVSWIKKNTVDEISVEEVWQACLSFTRRASMIKTE